MDNEIDTRRRLVGEDKKTPCGLIRDGGVNAYEHGSHQPGFEDMQKTTYYCSGVYSKFNDTCGKRLFDGVSLSKEWNNRSEVEIKCPKCNNINVVLIRGDNDEKQ